LPGCILLSGKGLRPLHEWLTKRDRRQEGWKAFWVSENGRESGFFKTWNVFSEEMKQFPSLFLTFLLRQSSPLNRPKSNQAIPFENIVINNAYKLSRDNIYSGKKSPLDQEVQGA